jgi:hypothetical protein
MVKVVMVAIIFDVGRANFDAAAGGIDSSAGSSRRQHRRRHRRRSISQLEEERDEVLRMIAALE